MRAAVLLTNLRGLLGLAFAWFRIVLSRGSSFDNGFGGCFIFLV